MTQYSYKIEKVDISQPDVIKQVNSLLGTVFNESGEPLDSNKILLNTKTEGNDESFYLAAIENDKIIGFNGFIAHELIMNDQIISCYQSCWTATSEQHRGKKIFPNLMNTAKEIQKGIGAGFLFGFPNHNSHPIMINKLHFVETPYMKTNIFNLPFFERLYLNEISIDNVKLHENAILQNDEQLIKLKKQEFGDEIKIISFDDSKVWGKVISGKKLGVNMKYFSVGGIDLRNSLDLSNIIRSIFSACKDLLYIQFAFPINHSYAPLFKRLGPAQTNNLLIYDLNFNTAKKNLKFNLMSGVKDVF